MIEETILLDEKIEQGNEGAATSKIISTEDDLAKQHTPEPPTKGEVPTKVEQEIETTLNQGMQFLKGIF